MLGLTMGLGSGVTASIARFIGDEDKKSADNSAEHALAMAGGIAIVFTILGIYYGEKILIALGAEGEILVLAWEYLSMIVLGLPFMVFSGFFRSILAGEGDMKFPMMVAGLGTLLNTILDPIFIFKLEDYGNIGFGMGVKGAAMATVFSQLIVFLIFIYMLFIKDHAYITFNLKDFMPSKIILWDIIKVGLPASLSMIIMALGQGVFNKILIHYSSQTVAAYQVAGRLDMLIFLPIFAIAGALTTLVGMFYGAREIGALNRIVRYGISSAFLITLVSSSFVYIFAETFSSWFTQDQEIISVSVGFLKRLCLMYPLVAIAITSGRVMQGLGKGLPVLLITIIRVLGVSAPLGLYFSFVLEKPVEWNWYAMMIAAFISFSIAIFWVRTELTKINRGQT
jgi:putative MATE family efflux protein